MSGIHMQCLSRVLQGSRFRVSGRQQKADPRNGHPELKLHPSSKLEVTGLQLHGTVTLQVANFRCPPVEFHGSGSGLRAWGDS